jgi:hypothetical protein
MAGADFSAQAHIAQRCEGPAGPAEAKKNAITRRVMLGFAEPAHGRG